MLADKQFSFVSSQILHQKFGDAHARRSEAHSYRIPYWSNSSIPVYALVGKIMLELVFLYVGYRGVVGMVEWIMHFVGGYLVSLLLFFVHHPNNRQLIMR